MNLLSHPLFAKALWVLPLLLFVISGALVRAGLDQQAVYETGTPVDATVREVYTRERSEITRGELRLTVTPPGEAAPRDLNVELPLTFLKDVKTREDTVLAIRMLPGHDQIVIERLHRTQLSVTFLNAVMALIGGLGLSVLVGGWNRYLKRHGDPAQRSADPVA